jgi:hypothetical protein
MVIDANNERYMEEREPWAVVKSEKKVVSVNLDLVVSVNLDECGVFVPR